MAGSKKLGMLTPSSNTALEPITQRICHPILHDVSVHFSRFTVKEISLDPLHLQQFDDEPMLAAARLLADASMDAILWNGTSGGWLGLDADRRLCETIERQTGSPGSTAILAQVEAMHCFGVKRYALATPYLAEVNEALSRTFDGEGFACVTAGGLGISVNTEFDRVPEQNIKDHLRSVMAPEVEAVLVVCTNFPAAYVVEDLERELGVPIIDSTVATVWKGLRMVGHRNPLDGWGRMMRDEF
ncbi:MAG: hypothetical protein WD535_04025 [Thermaerobacterales bacterium]